MKTEILTQNKSLIPILLAMLCLFIGAGDAAAQNIRITIKVASSDRITVYGEFLNSGSSFSEWNFANNYADVSNLAARIENLHFLDAEKKEIAFSKFAPTVYKVGRPPVFWKYDLIIPPRARITDAAHVSWLTADFGLLMLNDLLPVIRTEKNIPVEIFFDLPADFKVFSRLPPLSEIKKYGTSGGEGWEFTPTNHFHIFDLENAVFPIGRGWREHKLEFLTKNQGFFVSVAIAGEWQFSDQEILAMTRTIIEENRKLFGELPMPFSQIILTPFPQKDAGTDRWRAETRGATVTIVSGIVPLRSVAVQRLHEQLRHEIFHFWIPNAVNLSGNYDWFYEGFTIYQALKTGVELNQIRFEDYLKTLSRAYDISQELSETQSFSLIDASQERWVGADTFIYAKGMFAAFLCDVALLDKSGGKRSVKNIFSEFYEKHHAGVSVDGNAAALDILKKNRELASIVGKYIEGREIFAPIDYLAASGLEFEKNTVKNAPSKLVVMSKLNNRQKDLLDKLGYNQWRRLLQNKKD